MCAWSEDEYTFMKNALKAWPKGCAYSGTSISTGKKSNSDNDNEDEADGDGDDDYVSNTIPLFYNIKPLRNGRIAMGLYTDEQCIEEYPADTDYIESILGNVFLAAGSQHSQDNDDGEEELYYSGDTLSESMDRWDSAFDVWHMCHPCVAHDLENTGGTKYTDDDDGYGYDDDVNNYYYQNGQYYYYGDDGNNNDDGNNGDDGNAGRRLMNRKARSRKLGGEYAAEGDVFECYDDAGYTNVNQVRLFLFFVCYCNNICVVNITCDKETNILTVLVSSLKNIGCPVHEVLCQDRNENGYIPRPVPGKAPGVISRVPSVGLF